MASELFETGFQFPINVSALVTNTGGVVVGGIVAKGPGVAAEAWHPTKKKRAAASTINWCDDFR